MGREELREGRRRGRLKSEETLRRTVSGAGTEIPPRRDEEKKVSRTLRLSESTSVGQTAFYLAVNFVPTLSLFWCPDARRLLRARPSKTSSRQRRRATRGLDAVAEGRTDPASAGAAKTDNERRSEKVNEAGNEKDFLGERRGGTPYLGGCSGARLRASRTWVSSGFKCSTVLLLWQILFDFNEREDVIHYETGPILFIYLLLNFSFFLYVFLM